jgi:hypothetical protein
MERPTSSGGSRNRLTRLNLHEHDDDDDDVLKTANLFRFCHLNKLFRPETFGP